MNHRSYNLSYLHILWLLCAFFMGSSRISAQCFDMTTLDADGTYCACANHEFIYVNAYISYFDWKWNDNAKEDYGLTGYNSAYRADNILATRQTVISSPGTDYLQPALNMLPPGEDYSIRLGNPRAGGKGTYSAYPSQYSAWHPQAEAVYFEFTVTADNPIVLFKYAGILDVPTNHPNQGGYEGNMYEPPYYHIQVTDANNKPVNDNALSFKREGNNALMSNSDWSAFTRTGNIRSYWKDWSTVGFDLSNYVGRKLRFHVETYECVSKWVAPQDFNYCGQHFTYLYFSLGCTERTLEMECLPGNKALLKAPDGYTYQWYAKNNTNVILGTEQTLEVSNANGKTTSCCRLRAKEGMSSSFVLEITPKCNPEAFIEKTICDGDSYRFNGQDLDRTGDYEQVTHLSSGLDSTTHLHLTVLKAVDMPMEKATFCENNSYTWIGHGSSFAHLNEEKDYYDTLHSRLGCDSIRYHLQLKRISTISTVDHLTLCSSALSQGVTWHGVPIFGPQNNGITYPTVSSTGCDSIVILDLKIQDRVMGYDTIVMPTPDFEPFEFHGVTVLPGDTEVRGNKIPSSYGCDSIPVLRIIIADEVEEEVSCCSNELPLTWHGHTIHSERDNNLRSFETDNEGKNNVYILRLQVHPTYDITVADTICQGDGYQLGDTMLYLSGTYQRLLHTVNYGCDSLVHLTLTVQAPIGAPKITRADVCEGDFYTWPGHGERYEYLSETSIYHDTLRYTTGCDSAYFTLKLFKHLLPTDTIVFRDTICQGDSLIFFGEVLKTEGLHYVNILNQFDCDSVIGIDLRVGVPTSSEVQASFCEGGSYTFHGKTYDRPDTYRDTLVNALGCDSVVSLILTLGHEFYGPVVDDTIINGETRMFRDTALTSPGTYMRRFPNEGTCDSIVYLRLAVLPKLVTLYDTICSSDDSYEWHGQNFSFGEEFDYVLTDTVRDRGQVDSICYTMNLHIVFVEQQSSSLVLCETDTAHRWNGTIRWDDQTMPLDTVVRYTGRPSQVYELSYGRGRCESFYSLYVTWLPTHRTQLRDTICADQLEQYRWGTHTFATDRLSAADTLQALSDGCDSIVTFTLLVRDTFIRSEAVTVLPDALPYEWKHGEEVLETFTENDWYDNHLTRTQRLSSIYGCDSVVTFTLNLVLPEVTGELSVDTLCGDEQALNVRFICTGGLPVSYDILFADGAQPYFADTTRCRFPRDMVLSHDVPVRLPSNEIYVRPDNYGLTLLVRDSLGTTYPFSATFQVRYPTSVITQRWNDVLTVNNSDYNGGYEFSHIEWFHEGTAVQGPSEKNSYIYQPNGLAMGERYWALLTRADDGKTFRTCDFIPLDSCSHQTAFASDVQLVPRYPHQSRRVQVVTGTSGSYVAYDAVGRIVLRGQFGEAYGSPDIVFPQAGYYVVQFTTDEGGSANRKWVAR